MTGGSTAVTGASTAVTDGRGLPLSRRTVVAGLAGTGAIGTAGALSGQAVWRSRHVRYPLLSATVAVTGHAARVSVAPSSATVLIPGSRVAAGVPGARVLAAGEQSWLATGADWTRSAGRWSGLARSALLDLRSLTLPGGVAVAGWSPRWRYVWPRDAAFVAAAMAAAGHRDDAVEILEHLQALQAPDGWFEARYRIDGGPRPDARPRQLDSTGWVVWAVREVVSGLPVTDAVGVVTRLAPMVRRARRLILRAIRRPSGLPPPSPDYWEVPETVLTLGTAAPLLAGLSAAAGLLDLIGDEPAARGAAAGVVRLSAAIRSGFGPDRYPRHLHGHDGDAAVTFLLPPFLDGSGAAEPARAAATRTASLVRRSGGGLAPGTDWRADGASWTPETALFALSAAAGGDPATATGLLGWLEAHRTARGSLPEMVTYDGRPASVAPLAWTAALVVLTLSLLEGVVI